MNQSVSQCIIPYETDLKHFVSQNLFQEHKTVCFESKLSEPPKAIENLFTIWTREIDEHPSHVDWAMLWLGPQKQYNLLQFHILTFIPHLATRSSENQQRKVQKLHKYTASSLYFVPLNVVSTSKRHVTLKCLVAFHQQSLMN